MSYRETSRPPYRGEGGWGEGIGQIDQFKQYL